MRRTMGSVAGLLLCLLLVSCGGGSGSDSAGSGSGEGGGSDGSCDLMTVEAVAERFPKFGIDQVEEIEDGDSKGCTFTGTSTTGSAMALSVGVYDDESVGQDKIEYAKEQVGADIRSDPIEVVGYNGVAYGEISDGTYAWADITVNGSGGDDSASIMLLELLAEENGS